MERQEFDSITVNDLTAKRIRICGSDGQARIILTVDDDGNAMFGLADLRGAVRTAVTVDSNGGSIIQMKEANGLKGILISQGSHSEAGVRILYRDVEVCLDSRGVTLEK